MNSSKSNGELLQVDVLGLYKWVRAASKFEKVYFYMFDRILQS